MLSPKFELVKQRNPGLSEILDRLGLYIRNQMRAGQTFIVPRLAAAALGLNDGEAFVLLEILAKGDVVKRVYNVYCRETDMLLTTVESIKSLDEIQIPRCDFCDADHSSPELKVEIAFSLKDEELLNIAA
jgi:hypothetical protein